MAVNLGINIQRSPNRINQQLREAGVGGKYPKLLLDFADNYYLASGGSKTLANAVTHARSGNAVMTDGYGPELVTNGTFDTDSNWTDESASGASASIVDGIAILQGNNSRFTQNITTVVGKTYFVDATVTGAGSAMRINVFDDSHTNLLQIDYDDGDTGGAFTATSTTTEIMLYGYGTGITKFDNVSVREMPVLKWAPHNLQRYSEAFDNAGWLKTLATITPNSTTAPDGTNTGFKYTSTANGSSLNNLSSFTVVDGVAYTSAVFVKKMLLDGSEFTLMAEAHGLI